MTAGRLWDEQMNVSNQQSVIGASDRKGFAVIVSTMRDRKRLRSLDEFERLPWHDRRTSKVLGLPMILGVALAISMGALIGVSLYGVLHY